MKRTPCFLHGWADCPICFKHEGECDYGSCTAPATTTAPDRPLGKTTPALRPVCDRHAARLHELNRIAP